VRTDGHSTSDLLEAPVREVARLLRRPLEPRDGRPRPWLVPPLGVTVPIVWQHCDLTPHNVRWDGRRYSVVDWEAARPGPALCDLFYLLLHWPWSNLPSFGEAPDEVFRQVFLEPAQVPAQAAAHQTGRYCAALGIDAALVGPLLVHTLAQQALDRAERVRDSGDDAAADHNLYADLLERTMKATERVPAWTIR
jgi:aminoglycoside phosphotransferase (APT) family kinase protein